MPQLDTALVYRVPLKLTDQQLSTLAQILTADERSRADRFVVPHPRRQFIGCRAALRLLLGELCGSSPTDIVLTCDHWGKPHLAPAAKPPNCSVKSATFSPPAIHFNVSHSGDVGLIAVARTAIGVDIEVLRPQIHPRSLMSIVLSPTEQITWNELPTPVHQQQILRLWVCKEALLKALGLGISECLQQISFQLPIPDHETFHPVNIEPAIQLHLNEGADCRRLNWTAARSWLIHPLNVAEDSIAAVATDVSLTSIQIVQFDWSRFT
ncbi:MAG: 4'-phosphopantetheinyl transferase superfamily protein [Pirellulaceae bacterium]|nr:4'-phosphopantetheinyl transferase superfamily protein [Pirellulaceae bacterium]